MSHLQQRLAERNIKIGDNVLSSLANACKRDTALIIARLSDAHRVSNGNYGSNGDLVVLVVRNHRAVTIMYRRSNQPETAEAMRVDTVADISNDLRKFIQ